MLFEGEDVKPAYYRRMRPRLLLCRHITAGSW